MPPSSTLRRRELAMHVGRSTAALVALAVAVRVDHALLAVAASAALFFGAFALMHDAAHGALGLPRAVNEVVLSVAGALLLMSGHALRRTHLIHHRATLCPDDLEGAPALLPLWRAALASPGAALALRGRAFDGAGRAGRRWQVGETLVDVLLASACVASGSPALWAFVGVALSLQLSMGLWAAYVPHNAPAWLVAVARRLAPLGSPTFLSLAYHDLHHRIPAVPCAALPRFAARAALAKRGR